MKWDSSGSSSEHIPKAPSDPEGLDRIKRDFPRYVLSSSKSLWRVHSVTRQPLYFAHKGQGESRFALTYPAGVCYVATAAATAILETVIREAHTVDRVELSKRSISTLQVPDDRALANLLARKATIIWNVTRQFGTEFPYDRCQGWSEAFRQAEFDGIRYWAKWDVSEEGLSFALFGKAGLVPDDEWPDCTTERLDDEKWVSTVQAMGVTVLTPEDKTSGVTSIKNYHNED